MDFAYVIAPEWRGRGYAAEALKGVLSYCVDVLGVGSVWGECAVDNEASAAVMRRARMKEIGIEDGQTRFLVARS